jgi:Thermostable hemolysin
MPIPTIATGASTRFHTSSLIEAGHPERAEVEAFIAQVYAERYGATLQSFLPRLLAFRDRNGVLQAARKAHCSSSNTSTCRPKPACVRAWAVRCAATSWWKWAASPRVHPATRAK